MDKKPGLFLAVAVLAVIILLTAFDINIFHVQPVALKKGIDPDSVLYVCPAANEIWDRLASSMGILRKTIEMFFVFAVIVLAFSWAWALYQNLVKDKFSADAYKNPWSLTKIFFWAGVICTILMLTPNHFRKFYIHYHGENTEWVLCENTSKDAHPVNPKAIKLK